MNPLSHIQATNLYQKFDYRSKSILHDLNQGKRLIYRDKMCVCICLKLIASIAILKFDASSSRYRNLNLISYQHTFFNQSKQCFIHLNISPAAAMTDQNSSPKSINGNFFRVVCCRLRNKAVFKALFIQPLLYQGESTCVKIPLVSKQCT